ncbi:MAG: ABC transporter permease, partial [Mesorhizobium sp.]
MSDQRIEGRANSAASGLAAPRHRVDPLAIIVRFQSLIGLV